MTCRFVAQKQKIMENKMEGKRKNESRIFAGLILVVVGASLFLRNTGFPLPEWLFSWPMILILIGIYTAVKHNFRNNSWIILIALGIFFLLDRFIPGINLTPYFWPLFIIGIGLMFILRPERGRWLDGRSFEKKNRANEISGSNWNQSDQTKNFTTDSSDYLKVESVFSGIQRNIVSKNFQGGKIACVFGGADIDLSQAEINGRAEIKFEVVFGGAKLVVPPHWTVHNEIDGVFHGVDDKRKYNSSTDMNAEKVLVLRGSVVFGGVEIRSY